MGGFEVHPAVAIFASIGWVIFGTWIGARCQLWADKRYIDKLMTNEARKNIVVKSHVTEYVSAKIEELGNEHFDKFMQELYDSIGTEYDNEDSVNQEMAEEIGEDMAWGVIDAIRAWFNKKR